MPAHKQDLATRFWAKVEKTDGCWLWTGAKFDRGYGAIQIDGRAHKAHRIAYELTYNVELGDRLACHSCDNPSCVRPDHIFPGTIQDNNKDRDAKGRRKDRQTPYKRGYKLPVGCHAGERNPKAKLTQQQVDEIRSKHVPRVVTYQQLADEYGVSKSTIAHIIGGSIW